MSGDSYTDELRAALGLLTAYAERPGDVDPAAMRAAADVDLELLGKGLVGMCVVLLTKLARVTGHTELEIVEDIAREIAETE